jgi:hypothetical protein
MSEVEAEREEYAQKRWALLVRELQRPPLIRTPVTSRSMPRGQMVALVAVALAVVVVVVVVRMEA